VIPAAASRFLRGPLVPVFFFAALTIALACVVAPSFTWNLSISLPRGLYRLDRGAPPARGAVVSFVPPRFASELIAARGYLPASASLLKTLVALPGDSVCLDEASFVVNGARIAVVSGHDSAGRALAPFLFCGAVPKDSAFVATPARLSFDSRYFGPIPLSSLTVAVPVWTY
jgi:conjugative transfer signal peptidase TraF